MENILFLFILLYSFKWVIIVFSLLPVSVWNKRILSKYNKKYEVRKINIGTENNVRVSIANSSSLLKIVSRYITGYLRYLNFQTGLIPSHHIRNFLYKKVWLINMSANVIIYWKAEIRASQNLKIGRNSIIGDNCLLDARNEIEIGENVNISSNVSIYTEQHDHRDPYFACNSDRTFKVKIGNRAWIGPNVIILRGVKIGEGAVVAAGAVVTKNVADFTLVGGNPAKKIGDRNRDLKYDLSGRYIPFY
ncbi:acyltransferase [uncultured Bacteroides sp.]|uniref:acyltransferase n=1 Tax=uncultured Bacteroides sp. TaxID=162156 RepID=UPI002AA63FB1|nr:acyltransferase [uncultured Bacteroides sp.]